MLMEAFGVRFTVNDTKRLEALDSLYAEIKKDKASGKFRDPAEWVRLVPDEAKARFSADHGGARTLARHPELGHHHHSRSVPATRSRVGLLPDVRGH